MEEKQTKKLATHGSSATTGVQPMHDIRVITFNLLSPEVLSEESIANFYPNIRKNYLDFAKRVEKTKKLMQSWMKVNFIICVQEMSTQWRDELSAFFKENNYGFCAEVYSGGKMGVGIGFPLQHYDLLDVDSFACGNFIKPIYKGIKQIFTASTTSAAVTQIREQRSDESKEIKSTNTQGESFDSAESKKTDPPEPTKIQTMLTELEYASDSKNVLVSVLLRAKHFGKPVGKNVVISTFHMPCRYKYKYFLCSHIHALKVHLSELTERWNSIYNNTISTVFCGDFNITPKNPEYKYLVGLDYTQYELREDATSETAHFIVDLSEAYQQVGQDLFDGMQLRSTHKTLHTKEPDYTNVTVQKDRTFVECLDYILINNQVDIRSCTVGLSVQDPVSSPCPNGLCPSDHLPLSASLRIR